MQSRRETLGRSGRDLAAYAMISPIPMSMLRTLGKRLKRLVPRQSRPQTQPAQLPHGRTRRHEAELNVDADDGLSLHLPGGVVVPSGLSNALESGELVVFVGAGASVDPPSSLPLFKGLTQEVLGLAQSSDTPDPDGRYDVQLGDLEDDGFDVCQAVRTIIGAAGSSPNRWHRAIVDLWDNKESVRVVTTNYDQHIEALAGQQSNVWVSPALPLGRDFAGIVHLHGSLQGSTEGLVITDRHFGRAYLTEGWARRFLVELFRNYVVLFVGYSHSDIVLQYLARGLPPEARARYALVPPDEDLSDWDRLRITAIPWDLDPSDRYRPAVRALEEWGRRNRWSHLDHENHIKDLITAGPILDPIEDDYLTKVIGTPTGAQSFARYATGDDWLAWIANKQNFKEMFDRHGELDAPQRILAHWFAREQVSNGTGAALYAFGELGAQLSYGLWSAIAHSIWKTRPAQREDFEAWVSILTYQAHDGGNELLNYLAADCSLPGDWTVLLLLIEALIQPRLRFRPSLSVLGDDVRTSVDLEVRAEDHWFNQVIETVRSDIDLMASDVFEIATTALSRYHRIYRSFGQASDDYDPLSLMRSAIETHPQDAHNDAISLTVDLARDSAVALAKARTARDVADDLLSRRIPILSRLAVWLMSQENTNGT